MSASSGRAPGKVILFGEHAVVYGRPAVAVPVTQVWATAEMQAGGTDLTLRAVDLGQEFSLADAPADEPLAAAVRLTLDHLQAELPAATLTVRSTIPIASGMGSGAAVAVAVIRALAAFLGAPLADEVVSGLAYQVEKLHHGTPSGIDNTVVTYARPVYFVRGQPIQTFRIARPFRLLIADTGVPSPTRLTVGDVRQGWQRGPARYERIFDRIGRIATAARGAIESGRLTELGPLMNQNHALLRALEVSSPELDALAQAALAAGAEGAKLSGGGRGGNLIVLVRPETEEAVRQALLAPPGAAGVIVTWVGQESAERVES